MSKPSSCAPGIPATPPRRAACFRRPTSGPTSSLRPRTTGSSAAGWAASPRRWPVLRARPGATIRTGAEVDHVLVEDAGRGVVLGGGEEISSRLVISNADPKRTFLRLVQPMHLDADFRGRVTRLRTDAAYLKFHAALDRLPDFSRYLGAEFNADPRWLAYTQICPSVDYFRQSWADARAGRPSSTPLMSVQIPILVQTRHEGGGEGRRHHRADAVRRPMMRTPQARAVAATHPGGRDRRAPPHSRKRTRWPARRPSPRPFPDRLLHTTGREHDDREIRESRGDRPGRRRPDPPARSPCSG